MASDPTPLVAMISNDLRDLTGDISATHPECKASRCPESVLPQAHLGGRQLRSRKASDCIFPSPSSRGYFFQLVWLNYPLSDPDYTRTHKTRCKFNGSVVTIGRPKCLTLHPD